MDEKKIKSFLEEYKALCEKHEMSVGACGCCDSPWISETLQDKYDNVFLRDHINHLNPFYVEPKKAPVIVLESVDASLLLDENDDKAIATLKASKRALNRADIALGRVPKNPEDWVVGDVQMSVKNVIKKLDEMAP